MWCSVCNDMRHQRTATERAHARNATNNPQMRRREVCRIYDLDNMESTTLRLWERVALAPVKAVLR